MEKNKEKIAQLLRTIHTSRISRPQLKDYILTLLIYKKLSDDLEKYINEIERNNDNVNFEYSTLSDIDAEAIRESIIAEKGYFIYPSQLFKNIKEKSYSDKNLSHTIQLAFEEIEENSSDPKLFSNLFSQLNFDDERLGQFEGLRKKNIIDLLNSLGDPYLDNEVFSELFKSLLSEFIKNNRDLGETYTPENLSKLLVLIATNGKEKVNRIYDPAMGSGNLLINAAKILGPEVVEDGYYGQEINEKAYNIARMNRIAYNIDPKDFNISFGDVLISPESWDGNLFDLIISSPPSRLQLPNDLKMKLMDDERFFIYDRPIRLLNTDFAFILHSLSSLTGNGTATILCSPSVLFRGGPDQKIREYLIDNNFIDAVIQLPPNLLYGTSKSVCILVIKKSRTESKVLFINASEYFIKEGTINKLSNEDVKRILDLFETRQNIKGISQLVSKEEIEKEDFNLSVSTYIKPKDEFKFKNTKKLKDLVKTIDMGSYRSTYSKRAKERENVLVVNINNLNNEYIKDPKELLVSDLDNLRKTLEVDDIILSRNLNPFKGGLLKIDESDKPIVATSNSFVIKVNKEEIDPLYLLYILTSSIGRTQLEHRAPDPGAIRTLFAKTLEKIDIPIVSMERQKEIGQHYLKLLKEKEELQKQLLEKDEEIDTFIIKEII